MSDEIQAAFKKAILSLNKDVQDAVVKSGITRWRDIFLVSRIVGEEVQQYSTWGQVIDPFTLKQAVSEEDIESIVERSLNRIGEARGLSDKEIEAGLERAMSSRSP